MYFINENTKAVTDEDITLLHQVCIMLRTLCFMKGQKVKTNPEWKTVRVECHSVSRLMSLVFKELTLVDGILIGLDFIPTENKVTLAHTHHSWLRTPDGAIIDPYPMGLISTTSALLIPTSETRYCVHGGNLYHENPSIREHFNVAQCWRNASSCLRSLKKHSRKEDMNEIIASIIL